MNSYKPFARQTFDTNVLDKTTFKTSPVTMLPAFMVGQIEGDIYGIEDLVEALNSADFGCPLDPEIHTWWDFIAITNINQTRPTVDIYAVPRTNARSISCSAYGLYAISEEDLKHVIRKWYKTQGIIATYIEGWLAGRSKK